MHTRYQQDTYIFWKLRFFFKYFIFWYYRSEHGILLKMTNFRGSQNRELGFCYFREKITSVWWQITLLVLMLRTSCLDIPKAECIFYTFYFLALMNRVQELGENSGFPQALLSRIRLLELIFFKFSVYRCMIFPGSRLQQHQKQQN